MSAACETKNLFFLVRYRWGWKRLFTWRFWRYDRQYIWHDTFGRYFYRWIGCRVFGHRAVQDISQYDTPYPGPELHCFNCECRVPHLLYDYKGPVNKLAIEKFRMHPVTRRKA